MSATKILSLCMLALPFVAAPIGLAGAARGQTPLEAFGYRSRAAPIVRSALIVLAEFDDAAPLPYRADEYRQLFFDLELESPDLRRRRGHGGTVNGAFREMSNGRFTWLGVGVVGPFTLPAALGTGSNPDFRAAIVRAALDEEPTRWMAFDADSDGTVTDRELTVVLIHNHFENGGGIRSAGTVASSVSAARFASSVVDIGYEVDFATACHELAHVLGALDLYGVWSQEGLSASMTLMSTTPKGTTTTLHLDPWHKLVFGWVEPRILSLEKAGNTILPATWTLDPTAPVILHAPSRGPNEFFLLEYRSPQVPASGSYDKDVGAEGLVLWRVQQNPDHSPVTVPRRGASPVAVEEGWLWCRKCYVLHRRLPIQGSQELGPCAGGGRHDPTNSWSYGVAGEATGAGEAGWTSCRDCGALFFGPRAAASRCPEATVHSARAGANYRLSRAAAGVPGQPEWKRCGKCESLFLGQPSHALLTKCPSGGNHDAIPGDEYAVSLVGTNVAVWSEVPPDFARGGSGSWSSGDPSPPLSWFDGRLLGTRIVQRPYVPGASAIEVSWEPAVGPPR